MSAPEFVPSGSAIVRETLIVLGGAILAAFIISKIPALRTYIRTAWADTPNPAQPWE